MFNHIIILSFQESYFTKIPLQQRTREETLYVQISRNKAKKYESKALLLLHTPDIWVLFVFVCFLLSWVFHLLTWETFVVKGITSKLVCFSREAVSYTPKYYFLWNTPFPFGVIRWVDMSRSLRLAYHDLLTHTISKCFTYFWKHLMFFFVLFIFM